MEEVVLFDIDGTLFDPQKFGTLIRGEFVKLLNIDEDELIRANADYYANLESSTDFSPHDMATFLASRFGASRDDLDKIYWENDGIYKQSLYPEAIEVLKTLSKNKTLGIFSQGSVELQTRKLNACDIAQYFDREKLFIYKRKPLEEVIGALPQGALFVDDKHDVVHALVDQECAAIWINRRNEEVDPDIKTIHTLDELTA